MKARQPRQAKPSSALRARAEASLRGRRTDLRRLSPNDADRLVHELQVHQIELELQNEELRQAQVALAQSRDRLNHLYDYAPAGYLTLDRRGAMLEVNLTAAQMLGAARPVLLRRNLSQYICHESQDAFFLHRREVFASDKPLTCELSIRRAGGPPLWVQCECGAFVDPVTKVRQCRVVLIDITTRRAAQAQLKSSSLQLQALSQRLVESQESERHQLARELHDQIGQSLTAVQINLQSILAMRDSADVEARVRDSLELVDDLTQQTQDLSLSLRPSLLDDLGLAAALRWLIDRQCSRAGVKALFTAPADERRLEPDLETACFRVAQEAVTNVIRHSRASRLTVSLRYQGDALLLSVRDNGRGFNVADARRAPARAALGLLGMEERVALAGGELEVHSIARRGTTVKVRFPLRWRRSQIAADTI